MFITEIPLEDVFLIHDRNCRSPNEGCVLPPDIKALAESIRDRGLLQPVIVQPRHQTATQGQPFRLVAGYRRFAAVQSLGWESIPAVVRNVDDAEADRINMDENLERKDLNCLEEAVALERLYPGAQFSQRETARLIRRHQEWVSQRRMLLRAPPEIQTLFASGKVPISKIRDWLKPTPELLDALKQKRDKLEPEKPTPPAALKRRRSRREIKHMNTELIQLGLHGLATRCLAWAAGWISTEELKANFNEAEANLSAAQQLSMSSPGGAERSPWSTSSLNTDPASVD